MSDTSRVYRRYLLIVLLVLLTYNQVDRLALGLVMDDIKHDFQLSDTQLGILNGIAFALFYSIMGIPIAQWADRGNRVKLIGLTTGLWSAAVALSGLSGTFLQLVLIRVAVGVGEAGCVPAAHSLIADFFAREERARATSVFMQGISASAVIGYFLPGWLDQFYGWRFMFVALGLPGLALAVIAWASLREPRVAVPSQLRPAPSEVSLRDVLGTLWASRTFRHLLYAYAAMFFFSYGSVQWLPTLFIRSFGVKGGQLGSWLAFVYGAGGFLSTYLAGEWAVRLAARNERLQLQLLSVAICLSGVIGAAVYLRSFTPNMYWAFLWLGLSNMTGVIINIPSFAIIQTLVPANMRAMSIALIYLVANLIGMGLGPWAVGALSDAFRPWANEESIRYSLLALSPGYLWVAYHLWQASKSVTADIAKINTNPSQLDWVSLTRGAVNGAP